MMSQYRGYLKLWDCFLMLLILTYSVPSGFQLCQNMSDSGEFLLVVLESLVQFHQSPNSSFQLIWWVQFTAGMYSSPQKKDTVLVEDRWVEYVFIFCFHSSCTVGVKHNFEVWHKWRQSCSASEYVWLLPQSLPATAFNPEAVQPPPPLWKAPRAWPGGRSRAPDFLSVAGSANGSCLLPVWSMAEASVPPHFLLHICSSGHIQVAAPSVVMFICFRGFNWH